MKKRRSVELDYKEVPSWIEKLIQLLSPHGFEQGLKKYSNAKQSSDSVTTAHYVEQRHPWYEAILKYRNLKGNVDTADGTLRFLFETVAFNAIQLDIVLNQTKIPARVEKQLLRNLIGFDSAYPTMVEVLLAYHYWRDYAEVTWFDSNDTASEFAVKFSDFEFVVECKHFGTDTGKHVPKAAFARLSHLIGKIRSLPQLSGHILIELDKKLPSSDLVLKRMADEIQESLKTGKDHFRFQDGIGEATLSVRPASGIVATSGDISEFAQSLSPGAIQAIFSQSERGNVSPLVLSCRSKEPSTVYEKLKNVLSDAKKQIGTRQGMIFVHYQGLLAGDVERLKVEPAFVKFNQRFLTENQSVAAICYGSGPFSRTQNRDAIYNEALQFKNPYVPLPEGFSFINDGDLVDSRIITVAH